MAKGRPALDVRWHLRQLTRRRAVISLAFIILLAYTSMAGLVTHTLGSGNSHQLLLQKEGVHNPVFSAPPDASSQPRSTVMRIPPVESWPEPAAPNCSCFTLGRYSLSQVEPCEHLHYNPAKGFRFKSLQQLVDYNPSQCGNNSHAGMVLCTSPDDFCCKHGCGCPAEPVYQSIRSDLRVCKNSVLYEFLYAPGLMSDVKRLAEGLEAPFFPVEAGVTVVYALANAWIDLNGTVEGEGTWLSKLERDGVDFSKQRVVLSIAGGDRKEGPRQWRNPSDPDVWIDKAHNSLQHEITTLGFSGIDFNWENGVQVWETDNYTIFTYCLVGLISKLKADNPDLTISITIYHATWPNAYKSIWEQAKRNIDFVIHMTWAYFEQVWINIPTGQPWPCGNNFIRLYNELVGQGLTPDKILLGAGSFNRTWRDPGIDALLANDFEVYIEATRHLPSLRGWMLWSLKTSKKRSYKFERRIQKALTCHAGEY